jgi:hypothetical protein
MSPMMHSRLLVTLLLFGPIAARASTIGNFVVVNSGDPSELGGVFNVPVADAGTYYGSFSIDTSQIPTVENTSVNLTSFDMFLTGEIDSELNSSSPGIVGLIAAGETIANPDGSVSTLQFYDVAFSSAANGGRYVSLDLEFVEPAGTFNGGLVVLAQAFVHNGADVLDTSGSALAVDPAVLMPEPSSELLAAACVGFLAAMAKWRTRGTRLPAA